MYINQQDAQNSCDQSLFSIYAVHVSDCISPSSGAVFLYAVCHIRIYQIRHTAYKKIAPEDGLIQSETCRAYMENKD